MQIKQNRILYLLFTIFKLYKDSLICFFYAFNNLKVNNKLHSKNIENSSVIINSVRFYNLFNWSIELSFYNSMKSMGYDVNILIDDCVLNSNHYLTRLHQKYPCTYSPWKFIKYLYKIFLPNFYNDLIFISDFDVKKTNNNFSISNEDFISSVTRFYLSISDYDFLSKEKEFEKVELMTMNDLKIMSNLSDIIVNNYDILVTSHGFYTSWGPIFKKFKENKKLTLSYGGDGFRNGCVNISSAHPAAEKRININQFNKFHDNLSKNDIDINKLNNSNRISFKTPDTSTFDIKTKSNMFNDVKLFASDFNHVVGILPNVLWDNAVVSPSINKLFDSPGNWLIDLVKFAIVNSETGFIIRIHPSEQKIMKVRKGVYEFLLYHFPNLNEIKNIKIIPSTEGFNTYFLFDLCNAITVYNGTFGLECLYNKVKVVYAASSNIDKLNILSLPEHKTEYFNEILSLKIKNIKRTLVEALYYYYFNLNQYYLSCLKNSERLEADYKNYSFSELESILKKIIENDY